MHTSIKAELMLHSTESYLTFDDHAHKHAGHVITTKLAAIVGAVIESRIDFSKLYYNLPLTKYDVN